MDESGFRITGPRSVRVEWAAVGEVVAFKDDLFGVDEVCLGFRTTLGDQYWRVEESGLGYREMLVALPKYFPGIREDWWHEVAFPAFERNWTRLWIRD